MLKRFLPVLGATAMLCIAAGSTDRNKDPRITSVSPFVATVGSSSHLTIRGSRLEHVRSVLISGDGAKGQPVQAGASEGVLEAEVSVSDSVKPGRRHLRVVTDDGLTNELPFEIV